MLPAYLLPKRPGWARWSASLAGGALVVFIFAQWLRPWRPGRLGGLTFGVLATTIFVFDALYPLRRRLLARPFHTAQQWLQLHTYGGSLACLFVFIHMGFAWPAGTLGWSLLVVTLWATATGVVGVVLQKRLPVVLARNLSVEVIYERVPELLARLPPRADELMRESSDALRRVYVSDVRPVLTGPPPGLSVLLDLRGYRDRCLEPLDRLREFVSEPDRERVEGLKGILSEHVELEAHRGLQQVMRGWLLLHVPPAILLMALIVVHLFAVWYL